MGTSATARDVWYASPSPRYKDFGSLCLGYANAGEEVRQRNWRRLPFYGAVLIMDGNGWLETEVTRRRLDVGPKSLVWLFPETAHRYAPQPRWIEQWVLFTGDAIVEYERGGFISRRHPVVSFSDLSPILAVFSTIQRAFETNPRSADVYAGAVIPLLISEARQSGHHRHSRAVLDRRSAAVRLLEESAFEPIQLPTIAAVCRMSQATLRRVVREETGHSPKSYVMRLRLDRAKQLLVATDLSVHRVGAAVGFSDPGYFSRVFAQRERMTPSEFRRMHKLD